MIAILRRHADGAYKVLPGTIAAYELFAAWAPEIVPTPFVRSEHPATSMCFIGNGFVRWIHGHCERWVRAKKIFYRWKIKRKKEKRN
jgi:hypothetical protein